MKSKGLRHALSVTCMLFVAVDGPSSYKPSASRHEIKMIILEEAASTIVPPLLALAVARVESGFDANAVSSAGARGVMQIMPRTGREEFGVAAEHLWNARLNIRLGIYYLAQLYRQYGGRWDQALSHYNGGTLRGRGRYARPHGYTRQYVRSVYRWWQRYERRASIWHARGGRQ